MDFGIHIGTRGCLTTRENIMAMASSAEAAGYAIIGVADHLIVPVHTDVRYPYTADGICPVPHRRVLRRHRHPDLPRRIHPAHPPADLGAGRPASPRVLTASCSHRDVLSGGRVIAGVGSGWMKEEFTALETPPFEARGAVTDEYIQAWKALWTQDRPAMAGTHVNFENVIFKPKPTSKPHPPIWVGGESAPALRRAATMGDGWYPVSNNAHILMNTPALLKAGIDRLHRAADKAAVTPAPSTSLCLVHAAQLDRGNHRRGQRQIFTGSADAMREDAAAFAAVGVKHLIIYAQQPPSRLHWTSSSALPRT